MSRNMKLLSLLFLLLFQGCRTAPKKVAHQAESIRLYVFECGETDLSDLAFFAPGLPHGIEKKFVASCYVVTHPQGNLLWEAGHPDEIAKKPDGIYKYDGKFHTKVKEPFISKLKAINMTPKDIKYIAFSHFHPDHVGNANAFLGATLLIQKEEYAAAFGPEPSKYLYETKWYNELKNGPTKFLEGDYDVFGDGSVIIKRAIGHTPGHQMLYLNLPNTGPVLLSGDLYHFEGNRTHKRIPEFNADKAATAKSMEMIEDFIKQTKAQFWIQHDYPQIHALRHAPHYYD